MLKILGRSIRDFRQFFARLLLFQLIYALVTSFVAIPVITFLFNRMIRMVGSGSLLNGEVYRIVISYKGLAALLLIGLISSYVLLIELFVLILLVQQCYLGKETAIADAVLTALRKTPRLLGFGMFPLMLLLLLIIPFIDTPLSASFYALFNLPIFWNNHVLDMTYTMAFLYALLLAGALYTLLRWIFVPHFIVLEDLKLRQAVRESLLLTQGRRWQLFGALLLFNVAVLAAISLALTALSSIPAWLDMDVLALVSRHYSLTFSTMAAYFVTILLLPINIFLLTRLYYSLGRASGLRARDRIRIRPSKLGKLEIRIWKGWKRLRHKRILYASVVALYLAMSIFIGWRASESLVYARWSVLIAAHRGDMANAPENSLPAIVSAIDKGMQVVELDVQLTNDGVAVLNHDSDLRRVAGSPARVADLTFAQLRELSIGKDENGNPLRIPTLYEALAASEDRIKLLLDLKPYGGTSEALADEVVRIVRDAGLAEELRIQSFDGRSLERIRELSPDIKIGRILYFALGDLSGLDVDFYTIEQVMLTDRLVRQAHADGREVWVWTVNTRRAMKEVLKFQIDGMITDHPEIAQSIIEVEL